MNFGPIVLYSYFVVYHQLVFLVLIYLDSGRPLACLAEHSFVQCCRLLTGDELNLMRLGLTEPAKSRPV